MMKQFAPPSSDGGGAYCPPPMCGPGGGKEQSHPRYCKGAQNTPNVDMLVDNLPLISQMMAKMRPKISRGAFSASNYPYIKNLIYIAFNSSEPLA